MKKILRDTESVNKLMGIYKVSRVTVCAALNGETSSELAMKIRGKAIQIGCAEKGEEKVKVL